MDPIDKLSEAFKRFPGIGHRQAQRFVHYLLNAPQTLRGELAESIKALGSNTSQCKQCFRWFVGRGNNCDICADSHRNSALLFVIEKDADVANVEQSGFKGLYFVLGGTIPLASETPEKHIRLKELLKRVGQNNLEEIILGLSATTEGDHTRLLLQEKLKGSAKITSLGRGLSTGSELEYADPDTIQSALNSRI